MKRRTFLKEIAVTSAAAPFLIGGLPVRASSPLSMLAQLGEESENILIVVQLFGGNDGLNTLIPADNDAYFKLRPDIGIKKEEAWNGIGGGIYLNPKLAAGDKGGLAGMLLNGSLAIVQGVGYENPNLSHFRSTDIWLSGINSSDPNVRLETGWLGRMLEKKHPDFPANLPNDPLAIQMGGGFSLTLLSEKGRMGIEVGDPSLQRGLNRNLDTLDDESAGTSYEFEYNFVADIGLRSNKYAQRVKDTYAAGKSMLKGRYGSSGFAQQMASVAAMILGGLNSRVYVVTLGGFDTHVSQQDTPTTGAHPNLMATLGDSIAQFQYDMQLSGNANRVAGLTVSEFGRRPEQNGSFGTDHGAASVQFVWGTRVNSGVFGESPDLVNLNANGDLNYQIDYRQVYAEVLTDWFGLTLSEARDVLGDDAITPLDVFKSPSSGVSAPHAMESGVLSVFPNPVRTRATVRIRLAKGQNVSLRVADMKGSDVASLWEGWLGAGVSEVPLALNNFAGGSATGGVSGSYLLMLRAGAESFTRLLNVVQ